MVCGGCSQVVLLVPGVLKLQSIPEGSVHSIVQPKGGILRCLLNAGEELWGCGWVLGVLLTSPVKRQRVGCWKLGCDTPAWPGVDSVCLLRLPRLSSPYFEEKFIKRRKKKPKTCICLILSYNIQ